MMKTILVTCSVHFLDQRWELLLDGTAGLVADTILLLQGTPYESGHYEGQICSRQLFRLMEANLFGGSRYRSVSL